MGTIVRRLGESKERWDCGNPPVLWLYTEAVREYNSVESLVNIMILPSKMHEIIVEEALLLTFYSIPKDFKEWRESDGEGDQLRN